jgi:hypothetical protein
MSPPSVTPFRSAGTGCACAMNIILAISDRHMIFGRTSGGGNLWQGVQTSFAIFSSFAAAVFDCVSRETASAGAALRPIVDTIATAIAMRSHADRDIRSMLTLTPRRGTSRGVFRWRCRR